MLGLEILRSTSLSKDPSQPPFPPYLLTPTPNSFVSGGLFLDPTIPFSFLAHISTKSPYSISSSKHACFRKQRKSSVEVSGVFLSMSLRNNGLLREAKVCLVRNGDNNSSQEEEEEEKEKEVGGLNSVAEGRRKRRVLFRGGAINTTKHVWDGAMVSRTLVAPLERLKLDYIVRGEKKNIFGLIQKITATQGVERFGKGNFVNILRTATGKAVNFYAYDTYRKQLLRFFGNHETTNFERVITDVAAGITATVLCLPRETILTKIVALGGEALGGVIGAFHYMLQTEGRRRIRNMNEDDQELNALDQLERGPIRTLLNRAMAGACGETVAYPFAVVRRQLQLQAWATKMSALATCARLVEASVGETLKALVATGLGAAGQRCMALSTAVLVGGSVARGNKVVEHAKALKLNIVTDSYVDLGPVISQEVKDRIRSSLEDKTETEEGGSDRNLPLLGEGT